jgi:hypothetical protein
MADFGPASLNNVWSFPHNDLPHVWNKKIHSRLSEIDEARRRLVDTDS